MWSQDTTTHNYYGPIPTDLQQRAVEWTRAWGAPFRTALVNIENTLSIEVPDFDEDDYLNETTSIPAVRVDLLFVYTKPIDASSTTIARPVGSLPASITSPQLGLVRGAGVVSLAGAGLWGGMKVDASYLSSPSYTSNYQDQTQNYWFAARDAFDSDGNLQISSPMADLFQTSMGASGVYGNFPSPDDLMNLAPYITSELVGTKSVALIGQSVLPIAYVFVRKGQTTISNNDILDIRPFFRTTELTYNERSGIAAANPPISIANPVVSNSDVSNRIKNLYESLKGQEITVPEYARPVGAGVIFGGLKYGVEGALLRMGYKGTTAGFIPLTDNDYGFSKDSDYNTNQPIINKWFAEVLNYTGGESVNIPLDPEWEIAGWAKNIGGTNPGGSKVTDYINLGWALAGRGQNSTNPGNYNLPRFNNEASTWIGSTLKGKTSIRPSQDTKWRSSGASDTHSRTGTQLAWVKKKIAIVKPEGMEWMVDYDVHVEFANCVPISQRDSAGEGPEDMLTRGFKQYQGLYVEKYPNYFNIICAMPVPMINQNAWNGGFGSGWGSVNTGYGNNQQWGQRNHPVNVRNTSYTWQGYAGFAVTSDLQNPIMGSTARTEAGPADGVEDLNMNFTGCVYPTVKFTILGYPAGFKNEALGGGEDSTITLSNSY